LSPVKETGMTNEHLMALAVWTCSVVSPAVAFILIFAYGVEPPDWSAWVTIAAICTWLITMPWGILAGVTASVEERRWGGLAASGASAGVLVAIVIVYFLKGVLG
jgi:hypothetical protein